MIALGCHLARMSGVALPNWLEHGTDELRQAFKLASQNDIDLDIKSQVQVPIGTKTVVSAYDLHEAALDLNNNPPFPARVTDISVLFAGTYSYPGKIFGVMFDRGERAPDDGNTNKMYTSHPRESCAIFLDTIRSNRTTSADFETETRYTTIHEMGHIFNLQHTDDPSFMVRSGLSKPYPEKSYFNFNKNQKGLLCQCSTSECIWPGGTKFEDLGILASSNKPVEHVSNRKDGLRLRVHAPSGAFWPFEPVELDIELQNVAKRALGASFLDRLDPGYEEFRIWIEDPNGERRRYRSPRHYCAYPQTRHLEAGETFRRDVSIFFESGGFTFRLAGPHKIWAEFQLKPGVWLRSNITTATIRPMEQSVVFKRAKAVMTDVATIRSLYHRTEARGFSRETLSSFLSEHPTWRGAGRVEYAFGRALYGAALAKGEGQDREATEMAREMLQRAEDQQGLGVNQRKKIAEILDR